MRQQVETGMFLRVYGAYSYLSFDFSPFILVNYLKHLDD
jgi:hypothetical protein